MERADLVALLRPGVTTRGGRWADLGAGEGAFTLALLQLLGPDARITAVDKDPRSLRAIGHGVETRVADFTKPLDLNDLDGVVMANSLHFVRDKRPVLAAVRSMLRPGAPLIVVEYATDRGNPWCRTRSPSKRGSGWRRKRGWWGRSFWRPSPAATSARCTRRWLEDLRRR